MGRLRSLDREVCLSGSYLGRLSPDGCLISARGHQCTQLLLGGQKGFEQGLILSMACGEERSRLALLLLGQTQFPGNLLEKMMAPLAGSAPLMVFLAASRLRFVGLATGIGNCDLTAEGSGDAGKQGEMS
jgi:hypothetical protein